MDRPEPNELPQVFAAPPLYDLATRSADFVGVWPPGPAGATIESSTMPYAAMYRVAGGGTLSRMRGKGSLVVNTDGITVSGRSALPIQYISVFILIACIYFLPRVWFLPAYLIVVGLRFIPVLSAQFTINWDQIQSVLVQPGKPWASINYILPTRWSSRRSVSLCCAMTDTDLQSLRAAAEAMAPGRVVPGKLAIPAYLYIVIAVAVLLIVEQFLLRPGFH